MGTRQARDWEALEAPDVKRKVVEKDPHAATARRVREHVLSSMENWITAKHLACVLRLGSSYVGQVLKSMAEEGILSPLRPVPLDEDVKVGTGENNSGWYNVSAYFHDGQWVIGYYDKSGNDPKKTVLVHRKPEAHRWSRSRKRGIMSNYPTAKHWEKIKSEYKYEPAKWDGKGHLILRHGQAFLDACVAIGVEPNMGLPWNCSACGLRENKGNTKECERCQASRPKLLPDLTPKQKRCPNCDEIVSVSHARRHGRKQNRKEYYLCMQKLVDLIHKV